MDLLARLLEQDCPGHEAADHPGQRCGRGQVLLGQSVGHLRGQDQQPPRAALAGDRGDDLGARFGQDRAVRPGDAPASFEQDRPVLVEGPPAGADRGRTGAAVGQGRALDRPCLEGRLVPLEHGHGGVAVGRADDVGCPAEGQVEIATRRAELAQVGDHLHVERVATTVIGGLGRAEGRGQRRPAGCRAPCRPVAGGPAVADNGQRRKLVRACTTSWPAASAGGRIGRPSRRRGAQESLKIAEPVAPVAARVDPVVAQATLVAPRTDRVRMDAEEAGRLRHRKGRIRRPGTWGCGHDRLAGGIGKSLGG